MLAKYVLLSLAPVIVIAQYTAPDPATQASPVDSSDVAYFDCALADSKKWCCNESNQGPPKQKCWDLNVCQTELYDWSQQTIVCCTDKAEDCIVTYGPSMADGSNYSEDPQGPEPAATLTPTPVPGQANETGTIPPATQGPVVTSPLPTQAPPTHAPPTQKPPTQAPPTQAPPTQAPPTQKPPTQAPPTQAPPTQAPPTQAPPTQAPPTQAPSTKMPVPTQKNESTTVLPTQKPVVTDSPATTKPICKPL